jgi:chemotaxis protein methyltransferase CheR
MEINDPPSDFLRQMAFSRAAKLIDPSRNGLSGASLRPSPRPAEPSTPEGLVRTLPDDRIGHLHCALAEAMTLHETSFFRGPSMFDALRNTILPRLIEANLPTRQLRIWSAASSTGQEAFSIAMLICEYFPELADWNVEILGTDISSDVIDYATRGRYRRLDVNCGLPVRMLVNYMERDGDEWEVTQKPRSMCAFQCADLCTTGQHQPAFDLVMLRNVLLYLPERDRGAIFQTVHRNLTPSGYLVLGAAEQAEDFTDLFEAESTNSCYFYRPATRS